ncbi:VOC family protein [Nocardioides dongxiaopingii]|uniref:VOC family protein n=1 Tax=Nocardioides sp. S-1144 TaxID=2582905 RepID=UPI00110D3889|nr:VOC family protein [Nocardioides sp. S-1144]QCW50883.1 VOC family protein [Nocardioides sp. S-1144]
MTIQTVTHVNLRGTAREALEHYRSVFGGELSAFTFRDAGSVTDEAEADQVVWGQVVSEAGFHVMAHDVPAARAWEPGVAPYFVSVRGTDADELTGYWERLCADDAGATVVVPLGPAGWAALYGMVTDRFGVTWVLDVLAPYQG